MIIQLQPVQISLFWSDIQYSIKQTHQISDDKFSEYSNSLLANLLSGKFHCWLLFEDVDGKRNIHAIGITTIVQDNMFNSKQLKILSLYGYRRLTKEIMEDSLEKIKMYAQSNNCDSITLDTSISRIKELSKLAGFAKVSTKYSLDI